jgi:nucleotide-binding universal stress UspA family protein
MTTVHGPELAVTVDAARPVIALVGAVPADAPAARHLTDGRVGRPGPTQGAAISVGFDVGGAGTSALLWAVEEADRTGRELRLVNASDEPVSHRGHDTWRREVSALVRHLALTGLGYRLGSGPAAEVLLAAVRDAEVLVIGRRGGGRAGRGDVGGTAAALAQHCPVPLIVVPQQWSQSSTFNAPVVVAGSALDDIDEAGRILADGAMRFALERATRYRVPLVIVEAAAEPARSSSPGVAVSAEEATAVSDAVQRLEALRRTHTGVEIASRSLTGSVGEALTEMSRLAQLVVVSRSVDGSDTAAGGFLRHLLRRSSAPVAIIPHRSADLRLL